MVNNEVLNLCVVSAGFCRYKEREVGHKRHLSCLMVQRMLQSRIVSKLIGKVILEEFLSRPVLANAILLQPPQF